MARKKVEQVLLVTEEIQNMYEMVVIFKPFLPDKVRTEADEKVGKIITETGGNITTLDIWGKRYLAYKMEGHVEGYYVMYQFKTVGSGIDHIKKHLNRHQEIMKYLIIRKEVGDNLTSTMKVKQSFTTPKQEVVVA